MKLFIDIIERLIFLGGDDLLLKPYCYLFLSGFFKNITKFAK